MTAHSGVRAFRVHYSGQVQGVGFRATAVHLARTHPEVSGWVRNLSDGRVELWAEGPEAPVLAFLRAVHDAWPGGQIEDVTTEDAEPIGKYTSFSARR